MRKCTKCGLEKMLSCFCKDRQKKDGLALWCKDCRYECSKRIRAEHPERRKSWEAENRKKPHVKLYHKLHAASPIQRAKRSAYKKTEAGKLVCLKSNEKWIKRNPEKRKAQLTVQRNVRRGKIKRMPCEVCGSPKTDGHHDDYSRPLEVRWLCRLHHVEHHLK